MGIKVYQLVMQIKEGQVTATVAVIDLTITG
jgi:hypothetical protein